MKHLKLSMYGAHKSGVTGHPQKIMKDLGITYQNSTPQSLYDSWWFWNCENIPDVLPGCITELNVNPMECIGNGLSNISAESIRDYKSTGEQS